MSHFEDFSLSFETVMDFLWFRPKVKQKVAKKYVCFFSRGHATHEAALSVGWSVRPSVGNQNKMRAFFFAIPLLPTRPRLRGSVYGLVFFAIVTHRCWSGFFGQS